MFQLLWRIPLVRSSSFLRFEASVWGWRPDRELLELARFSVTGHFWHRSAMAPSPLAARAKFIALSSQPCLLGIETASTFSTFLAFQIWRFVSEPLLWHKQLKTSSRWQNQHSDTYPVFLNSYWDSHLVKATRIKIGFFFFDANSHVHCIQIYIIFLFSSGRIGFQCFIILQGWKSVTVSSCINIWILSLIL